MSDSFLRRVIVNEGLFEMAKTKKTAKTKAKKPVKPKTGSVKAKKSAVKKKVAKKTVAKKTAAKKKSEFRNQKSAGLQGALDMMRLLFFFLTPVFQMRTSNVEIMKILPHFNVQCSMFDVRCSYSPYIPLFAIRD